MQYELGLRDKQISGGGTPLYSGLEVLSSVTVYGEEQLSYKDSFLTDTLQHATDHATNAADPSLDAVTNSSPSVAGDWYIYHTHGSGYESVSAPSTATNTMTFNGKVGTYKAHSGAYQKLSNLEVGQEYFVEVFFRDGGDVCTFTIKHYFENRAANGNTIILNESKAFTTPISRVSMSFTAQTRDDIILFDITSDVSGNTSVQAYAMSVRKKQEYLVPVLTTNNESCFEQVLRQQITPTQENEQPT